MMWYGKEVVPSFDCDIEIKQDDGTIEFAKFDIRRGFNIDTTTSTKWRFIGDIQYFRGSETTPYLKNDEKKPVNNERVQHFTIKHLENENAYLRQEVEILKERIIEYEIQGKDDD